MSVFNLMNIYFCSYGSKVHATKAIFSLEGPGDSGEPFTVRYPGPLYYPLSPPPPPKCGT